MLVLSASREVYDPGWNSGTEDLTDKSLVERSFKPPDSQSI